MSHKKKRHFVAQPQAGLVAPAASASPTNVEELLLNTNCVLHVHSVDVVRLKDDKAPIQVGEELMFVAKSIIELVDTDAAQAILDALELKLHDDLLEIGADADLVSEAEIGSDDAVAEVLTKKFKLKFTFKVNGVVPPGYKPAPGDPPWVFRFDTSVYPTDYLKVDVDVSLENPSPVQAPPPPPAQIPAPAVPGPLMVDVAEPRKVRALDLADAGRQITLALQATLPETFTEDDYLLPLHNQDAAKPSLWLRVHLAAVK